MAGILEKNDPSGKPIVLPDGLTNSRVLNCGDHLCQVSYTLAYGQSENRIQSGWNVIEIMREKANKVIGDNHPAHSIEMYIWGGIEKGWLDRREAKAAGL